MLRTWTDADLGALNLSSERVAIVGYGSQGRAHALNLRDAGVSVKVALPPSSRSRERALEDGFSPEDNASAAAWATIIMLLAPDERQAELYARDLAPSLRAGHALAFAHGFAVHHRQIVAPPDVDVIMAAPMGAGPLVRREFERGHGVPCLVAVAQDASGAAKDRALAYAKALGGGRVGILETTFAQETETDLFAEQAVLCGGVNALVLAAFETLTEAGYPEELAYFSCLHELKFTVDLMHERGIAGMRDRISNTAKYGDLTRGPRVLGPEVKQRLATILDEIRTGAFGAEWIAESAAGRPELDRLLERSRAHAIESVGARLRSKSS